MVLTLKEICHTRNVVLHLKDSVDLQSSISSIGARLKECSLVFSHLEIHMFAQPNVGCSPPSISTIKLNVDAAVSLSNTALVVVARNEHGVVLKVWAKIMPKFSPFVAEIEAIL